MNSHKRSSGVLSALSAVLLAAAFSHAGVADTVRVNCGGGDYTDVAGHKWVADSGGTGGTAYALSDGATITGTNDQVLWQDESYGNTDNAPFFYSFNMAPAGNYTVKLYLAEIYAGWCSEGSRVFNADINGTPVLTNYDIYAAVGCDAAVIKQFGVTTGSNGNIKINFTNVNGGHPKVNAIEIVPGLPAAIFNKTNANQSKLSISSSKGGVLVQTQFEGAYTLELSNLQGKRMDQKHGFGAGSQSFTNLKPGLYFLTSHVGHQSITRTISVVR